MTVTDFYGIRPGAIPGYPASHGCARVSNPAMDMIWANNLMPVGSSVVVY